MPTCQLETPVDMPAWRSQHRSYRSVGVQRAWYTVVRATRVSFKAFYRNRTGKSASLDLAVRVSGLCFVLAALL